MIERRQRSRRGFTLVELVLVVVIIVLLSVIMLPELVTTTGPHFVTACQSNLRSIGTAMFAYHQDYNDRMPVIRMSETALNGANSVPTAANQTDAEFSSGQWQAVLGDQAMQNVWLLVAEDALSEHMFKCPADEDWVERPADAAKYGWTDPRQYSYGMQWPYRQDAAGRANPAQLGAPSTITMADFNPGGPVGESRPQSNHPKNGLNVVLASGGADKHTDTASSTYADDELYANDAGEVGGLPQGPKDTSITLSGR